MNSTTSDFTQIRKSSEKDDLFHLRGTLTSSRRKTLPRRYLNLTPLNLNEIKKEVEAELQKTVSFVFNENVEENDSVSECAKSCGEENTLKNVQNFQKETEIDDFEAKTVYKKLGSKEEQQRQGNDSFDLDFSVLSVSTPVKKVEMRYTTPKVNNNRLPVCHEDQISKFDSFVTPKVKNCLPVRNQQVNGAKNNAFATPIQPQRSCSSMKTPFSTTKKRNDNFMCSLPPQKVLKDETFSRICVKNVEYLVLSLLGRGGSSEVFQCYNLQNKQCVAVKCVSLQNSSTANGYINEVKLLQQLQECDKIIKLYDFELLPDDKKLYVVLEKGGEDLSTILKKLATQRAHIPIYILLFYWMDMLHAVQQIHSHGVIHSDLKPANFIRADSGLKLIDFGIASSVQNDETSVIKTNPEGSCNYISPEALNNDGASGVASPKMVQYKVHFKSDVWSLGCILYQLVYRRTPFSHVNNMWAKLNCIMNPNHVIEYPDADWAPPKIVETIRKCLRYDFRSRPSVQELIEEYEEMLHNICRSEGV